MLYSCYAKRWRWIRQVSKDTTRWNPKQTHSHRPSMRTNPLPPKPRPTTKDEGNQDNHPLYPNHRSIMDLDHRGGGGGKDAWRRHTQRWTFHSRNKTSTRAKQSRTTTRSFECMRKGMEDIPRACPSNGMDVRAMGGSRSTMHRQRWIVMQQAPYVDHEILRPFPSDPWHPSCACDIWRNVCYVKPYPKIRLFQCHLP